jgi:ubiquinone/menaquinone biosynthesis C-methylase UbiE
MLWPDLSTRNRQEEWMDRPDVDPGELARSLKYIRCVNRYLGYSRATVRQLEEFSKNWPPGHTIRVIDFATGSADTPLAILRWADRRGLSVRVVGLDLHPRTASIAGAARRQRSGLSVVRGDALCAPFADHSFDYAICGLFLHHLDDADAVRALREMDRVARRGIIAGDLARSPRAYAWIWLLTLGAGAMVRHDARVSVEQAFTRREMLSLRDRAGLAYLRYVPHFAHHGALVGEKG